MKLYLDGLIYKNETELKELFLTINSTTVEISGTFSSTHAQIINLLTYLPRHVTTVELSVQLTKVSHAITNYGSSGYGMSERQVVTGGSKSKSFNIGDLVARAVANLPKSVRKLSIIFNKAPTYDNWHNPRAIANIFNSVSSNIIELDLSRVYTWFEPDIPSRIPATVKVLKFQIQVSYQALCSILSIPSGIEHILLDNSIFLLDEEPSKQPTVHPATRRQVTKLSFKNTRLGQQKEAQIVTLFSLANGILDLDLSGCELGSKNGLQLQTIFMALPAPLRVLGLSNNNFRTLSVEALIVGLSGIRVPIDTLDLSDNELLLLDDKSLQLIFAAFPKTIKQLKLVETTLPGMTGIILARRLSLLPPHINTFNLSDSNLFGLCAQEFVIGLSALSQTITTLDLSGCNLDKKSEKDLLVYFQGMPRHINKLIVKRNNLSRVNPAFLKELLEMLPPHVKEIDFAENGFDTIVPSQLNHFINLIPDSIRYIKLDSIRFAIQNDGSLVSVPPTRNYPGLFKPQGAMSHQKEFARLRLVLMQLFAMHPRLPLELISSIVSQAIKPTTPEALRYWEHQLSKRPILSSTLPELITPACRDESRATAFERIDAATAKGATRVDLSRCGLNRLNQIDMIIELFQRINWKATELSLRGNGLGQTKDTVALTIQILAVLPAHIKYLDLSANGFERYTAEQLTQLFSHIRPSVALVSLGQEKPLHPLVQIAIRQWPSSYTALTAINNADMMHRARALLVDYTKGDSGFMRFVYGHWNRNHAREVTQLITLIDMKLITNMNDLIAELELIDKSNDKGSLAKRLSFLVNLCSAPQAPLEPKVNLGEGSELKCLCLDT